MLCTIAGFVGLFFLPLDTPWLARIAVALGIGCTGALSLMRFAKVVADERLWQHVRHLPARIHIEQQDERIVCFFERIDGEPGVLTLPEGYDPREDEGRHLFELLGVERESE